jgi:protein SCO1/2
MKRNRISLVLVIFFIVLGAAFSIYYFQVSKEIKKPTLIYYGSEGHKIRPFKFLNQNGDTITEQDVKNKILVVEYFFTTCKGICPKMNENMAKVYREFKNDDNVVILSHTVDPERDTVEAMNAYAMRFEADPKRWIFLTGSKEDLYNQAYYSYLMTAVEEKPEDINEAFIHTEKFVLVDKNGRLRVRLDKDGMPLSYDGTDEKSVRQMIEDIKLLEQE